MPAIIIEISQYRRLAATAFLFLLRNHANLFILQPGPFGGPMGQQAPFGAPMQAPSGVSELEVVLHLTFLLSHACSHISGAE